MSKDQIINSISSLKKPSCLNYGIKTKTEAFTEKLFYTLFDPNAPLDESIDEIEKQFKEIASIACNKSKSLPEKTPFKVFSEFSVMSILNLSLSNLLTYRFNRNINN